MWEPEDDEEEVDDDAVEDPCSKNMKYIIQYCNGVYGTLVNRECLDMITSVGTHLITGVWKIKEKDKISGNVYVPAWWLDDTEVI